MADELKASSDLSKIAKLNGDFRRNYGKLLGAFLYPWVDQRRARPLVVLGRLPFCCLLGGWLGLGGTAFRCW